MINCISNSFYIERSIVFYERLFLKYYRFILLLILGNKDGFLESEFKLSFEGVVDCWISDVSWWNML